MHYHVCSREVAFETLLKIVRQMRTRVLQGRDFLNSVRHFEPFVDGASKLRNEITMKKMPTGCISFVSKAWGGWVSDDQLTRSSGILQKLCPGDVVMADRGYWLQQDFGMLQCELVVPSFTKGKLQLSAKDAELSRAMSHDWIHVERSSVSLVCWTRSSAIAEWPRDASCQ